MIDYLTIYISLAALLLLFPTIIFISSWIKRVKRKSILLVELNKLNKKYNFNYIKNQKCSNKYKSKAKLDRTSTEDYLMEDIACKLFSYQNLIEKIDYNRTQYKTYRVYYNKLDLRIHPTSSNWVFKQMERYLWNKNKLKKPRQDINLFLELTYTSPAGRNHYYRNRTYTYDDIIEFVERVQTNIKIKSTREYQMKRERSKMTDSLRYDILKRDKFRCKICGENPEEDGVKLHVDHIIAVSKGGKTTSSNLRSLCESCNLGKSDKDEI